jgi:death-on-curing protein
MGVRDEGLLESALARPLNRAGYGEPDTAELAALYAIAIDKRMVASGPATSHWKPFSH